MKDTTTRRLARSALLVAVTTAGCATRGDLHAAVAELRAEQARQAAEVAYLRERLDGRRVPPQQAPAPRPQAESERPARPAAFVSVPLDDSPVEGPADAWVTVVEFTDFQCPFCGRAQTTLRQLRERYGGSIRFVVKHNPLAFHPNALPAAIAAECARAQGAFWPYERILFERQSQLGNDRYPEWAREVTGIDVERFQSCVVRGEPAQRVEGDRALAARLGVSGTPTFFINGRRLVGAQPLENFVGVVDEELAKARASGVPAREYYERAVQNAVAR